MLRVINYFRLRRHRKALLGNANKVHTITDAYAWIKRFKALKDDTALSSHIKYIIPPYNIIKTKYDNFANLMDALYDARMFYEYGSRLMMQPREQRLVTYTQFLKNNFNVTITNEQAIDYIEKYAYYYIDDLVKYSIDTSSTTVAKTKDLIIDIASLMQAILVL